MRSCGRPWEGASVLCDPIHVRAGVPHRVFPVKSRLFLRVSFLCESTNTIVRVQELRRHSSYAVRTSRLRLRIYIRNNRSNA